MRNFSSGTSRSRMRFPFFTKSPRVRSSTQTKKSDLRSHADEHERGAHLLFVWLLRWGTRNN